MLKSFSDKRKNLFTIIAEQLKSYAIYYEWDNICIRKDSQHFKEVEKSSIKIVHNKGITYFNPFNKNESYENRNKKIH